MPTILLCESDGRATLIEIAVDVVSTAVVTPRASDVAITINLNAECVSRITLLVPTAPRTAHFIDIVVILIQFTLSMLLGPFLLNCARSQWDELLITTFQV